MRLIRFALIPAVALLIAACSSGSTPTAAPASASAAALATRVDVTLTDSLRMEPASMSVPAGVPVTFVVTNTGAIDHEFFLGDEAAQADHEEEMAMGGMTHDQPEGISLKPGETKELTYTFAEASPTLAGCHIPGHYDGGMKAQITVGG